MINYSTIVLTYFKRLTIQLFGYPSFFKHHHLTRTQPHLLEHMLLTWWHWLQDHWIHTLEPSRGNICSIPHKMGPIKWGIWPCLVALLSDKSVSKNHEKPLHLLHQTLHEIYCSMLFAKAVRDKLPSSPPRFQGHMMSYGFIWSDVILGPHQTNHSSWSHRSQSAVVRACIPAPTSPSLSSSPTVPTAQGTTAQRKIRRKKSDGSGPQDSLQ